LLSYCPRRTASLIRPGHASVIPCPSRAHEGDEFLQNTLHPFGWVFELPPAAEADSSALAALSCVTLSISATAWFTRSIPFVCSALAFENLLYEFCHFMDPQSSIAVFCVCLSNKFLPRPSILRRISFTFSWVLLDASAERRAVSPLPSATTAKPAASLTRPCSSTPRSGPADSSGKRSHHRFTIWKTFRSHSTSPPCFVSGFHRIVRVFQTSEPSLLKWSTCRACSAFPLVWKRLPQGGKVSSGRAACWEALSASLLAGRGAWNEVAKSSLPHR